MSTIDPQEFGQLQATVKAMGIEMRDQKLAFKVQADKVDELISLMNAGKGSWRTILRLGAVATALLTAYLAIKDHIHIN